MQNTIRLFKSITIFEAVLTMVLAAAIGVSFWGWTFVYEVAKPMLKILGLSYLSAGFWIFSTIFIALIVRKPGIAIIGSVIASFIQGLLTHWGLMSIAWGLVQGLGAEIIFFCFAYKKWDLKVLILASSLSATMSYLMDYLLYDYGNLAVGLNLLQISSFIVSSIFLAGVLSLHLAKRLLKMGILDQFLIAKD